MSSANTAKAPLAATVEIILSSDSENTAQPAHLSTCRSKGSTARTHIIVSKDEDDSAGAAPSSSKHDQHRNTEEARAAGQANAPALSSGTAAQKSKPDKLPDEKPTKAAAAKSKGGKKKKPKSSRDEGFNAETDLGETHCRQDHQQLTPHS